MTTKGCFIDKLTKILNDAKNEEIIRWTPDNCGLIVFDRNRLVNEVFPDYFNHRRFTSFVRQLINYGFRRKLLTGQCIYIHQDNLFKRGQGKAKRKFDEFLPNSLSVPLVTSPLLEDTEFQPEPKLEPKLEPEFGFTNPTSSFGSDELFRNLFGSTNDFKDYSLLGKFDLEFEIDFDKLFE